MFKQASDFITAKKVSQKWAPIIAKELGIESPDILVMETPWKDLFSKSITLAEYGPESEMIQFPGMKMVVKVYATNHGRLSRTSMGLKMALVKSIAHELRHAYQHANKTAGLTKGAYKKAEDNFEEYRNQEVEVDARAYAEDFARRYWWRIRIWSI